MKSALACGLAIALLGSAPGTNAWAQQGAHSSRTACSAAPPACAPPGTHGYSPSHGPCGPPGRDHADEGHYRWVQRQVWEWGHWEQRYDTCGRLVQVWNPGGYRTVTVREWVPHVHTRSASHNERYYARH